MKIKKILSLFLCGIIMSNITLFPTTADTRNTLSENNKTVTVSSAPKNEQAISLKTPVITSAKSSVLSQATIQFSKISNADKYEIQYDTSPKYDNFRRIYVSSKYSSATLKNLLSGKAYYVRVRAIATDKGKTYYSRMSRNGKFTTVSGSAVVARKLKSMSLARKVCQMFIIQPEQLNSAVGIYSTTPSARAYKKYPVGGLIFFSSNLKSSAQVKQMTKNVKSFSAVPPFIGIDEEGGCIARFPASGIKVPTVSNMYVYGKTGNVQKAYQVGNIIGRYLNSYGFDINFAPDCDVVTNVNNSAIGVRSFGGNAKTVSKMAGGVIKGLQANNIEPCLKHFPGLGASNTDTHLGFAVFNQTYNQLKSKDLVPFKENLKNVNFIMVGHGSYPKITGNYTPASLSKKIITGILRKDLGYKGIVVTDALGMGAIAGKYGSANASIMAINAGVDMLTMPYDFKSAFNGVMNAVKSGKIKESRINESVTRILEVKYSKQLKGGKINSIKSSSVNLSSLSTCDGYEIQVSTNSKFQKPKTIFLTSDIKSYSLKKYSKNKKYYIRIRTFISGKNKTFNSKWSKASTFTLK